MFRASSAHLQEDTVVHMQHMVLSLSTRVRGGLSVHNLSENWLEGEGCWWVSKDKSVKWSGTKIMLIVNNSIPYLTWLYINYQLDALIIIYS